MTQMTKRERVREALAGREVDRTPHALWGHDYLREWSPEDLVAMKILAGRRKDLDDVRGVLLEQAERLDLERTRDVLGALEAALDDARLLRRLDRQLAAVRKAASRASPARPKPRR